MKLTLSEAADRLGVHYMTVYRWVHTGRLPALRHGREWLIDPADIAALQEVSPLVPSSSPRSGRVDHAERQAHRLLEGDESGALAVAEAALAGGMSPEALYLDVLAGAMRRIGDSWAAGKTSVAQEHHATAIMQRLLGRLARSFARRGRRRGVIVLGAAAGDAHSLPVSFVAEPLRGRGFSVVDLGANTPPDAFVDAALRAGGAAAIGITLSMPPLDPVAETIEQLRAAGVIAPLVVGGAAILRAEDGRNLGADLWSEDGWSALELLTRAATS
jgi:excisionase family DNA binding protein